MHTTGIPENVESASAVAAFVKAGVLETTTTPGSAVASAHPAAIQAAPRSSRVSMIRIPSSSHDSRIGLVWSPHSANTVDTPRARSAHATSDAPVVTCPMLVLVAFDDVERLLAPGDAVAIRHRRLKDAQQRLGSNAGHVRRH